ncbi:hypothetical protein ACJRO7_018296 [Eucalyptus globulus]|uniref:Translation initiation factor IF-2, mitochondrial n=1 Tax=Eucalyptus globulus TaxID=34317 RepID=A0ABD3KT70_EUCGL
MAWRALGNKGLRVTHKILQRHALGGASASCYEDAVISVSALFRCFSNFSSVSLWQGASYRKHLSDQTLLRCFNSSTALLARGDGQFENRTQPPVEAPYVPPKVKTVTKSSVDRTIDIFEGMTIVELAKRTSESLSSLQDILLNVGEKVESEFDPLSIDIAELVAMELGVNVRRRHSDEGAKLLARPPVVTVMGHVDHGKTFLDALRQTSLVEKEAGGITQHLGAFVVSMPLGSSITFLDTPGHAAFNAMRARVMPQTREAMSHATLAKVPVVVAINKCDKPAADPEQVKLQLASEGLLLEEMGGDVQVVEVSAVKKTGLDRLEEALLLQAELMDLKARIDGPAQAYVVEARLDRGRGPLATAIMKAGTLVCGQYVVVGSEWGRIRALRDMVGKMTDRATPAMPIEIEGLKGLPMAGDDIVVVDSEERARMLSTGRTRKSEKDRLRKISEGRTEAEESSEEQEVVERVEMPIIVKADVQGTVQAVTDALKSLNSPQVFVNIVHVGVGPVSQSDIDLARACGACIVGFNVKNPPSSIKTHRVIYHLLEDMGSLIIHKAPGTAETQVAGEAQVLNIFELKGRSKSKGADVKIAGCRVIDGQVTRSSTMRLLRSGEVMFEGSCASLKREKKDVEMVGKGNECGLVIRDWDDFQVGDIIQCLEQVVRKPKFISSESGAVRIEC